VVEVVYSWGVAFISGLVPYFDRRLNAQMGIGERYRIISDEIKRKK
jgi:hypothetical protein